MVALVCKRGGAGREGGALERAKGVRARYSGRVTSPIIERVALGFPWPTQDPFLFCVHHLDAYPRGNERMGPEASLGGRNLGQDFEVRDGWRMYHGRTVPGFPQHPHRGFETVTIVRQGYIDHCDSLGAAARFGQGDVQWLTTGKGVVHSEMFPLLNQERDNPVELFQIWLNLPASDKLVEPYFSMLWAQDIPRPRYEDDRGRATEVTLVAGSLGDVRAPAPPPHSWASRPESELLIASLKMDPGAKWTLPPAAPGVARTLYFFAGESLRAGPEWVTKAQGLGLAQDQAVELEAGPTTVDALLLQARPIQEPVAQHGPFVMNTRQELQQAFVDFQRTGFGGWPWPKDDPVHAREETRFARHADGRVERFPLRDAPK